MCPIIIFIFILILLMYFHYYYFVLKYCLYCSIFNPFSVILLVIFLKEFILVFIFISSIYLFLQISELISYLHSTEKLSELSARMRYFFCILIKDSLSGLFPYCDVFPFGSSVNGVGKQGCDLDIMIRLYPEEVMIIYVYKCLML